MKDSIIEKLTRNKSLFLKEAFVIIEQFTEVSITAEKKTKNLSATRKEIKEKSKQKKANDPLHQFKLIRKINEYYTPMMKFRYIEKSLFVFLHSLFEKHINSLICLIIENDNNVFSNYLNFVIKKNEKFIKEKNKGFITTDFLLLNEKEKKIESLKFLPHIYQEIGFIDLSKKLLDIKDYELFTYSCRNYYESKERRNREQISS